MEILSTNIGAKRKITYKGKEIYTGIYKYPVYEPLHLGIHDVNGDSVIDRKYHGGIDKACYLYSADHYSFWKEKYPNLNWQWGMFGENLTIEGLDESELHIGDIFKVGTAVVQITQPRQPCFKLGVRMENAQVVKDFIKAEKPGAYIRVIEKGEVKSGDSMQLVEQKAENFTVTEIYHFIYQARENIDKIKEAIKIPELAESCRKDLIKYVS
jgi:MOSC domain-containing protein YiiM